MKSPLSTGYHSKSIPHRTPFNPISMGHGAPQIPEQRLKKRSKCEEHHKNKS